MFFQCSSFSGEGQKGPASDEGKTDKDVARQAGVASTRPTLTKSSHGGATMARPSLTRRQRAAAAAVGMIPVMAAGVVLIHGQMLKSAFGLEIATGLLYFAWVMRGEKTDD